MKIRIGTRGSDLALWQAHHVQALLHSLTGEEPELVIIKTKGDQIQDVPLTASLGKSFFTKEIEEALLSKEVDLAIHSLKDLAVEQPDGLCLAAVPPRESPGERLLIQQGSYDPEAERLPLPKGARVGTSSPRRQKRLKELRPDLELLELRGNVPTRVRKVQEGQYDAIMLACAGLNRLALDTGDLVLYDIPLELFPGAPGQGALGLQARAADTELLTLVKQLEDPDTALATRVERDLLKALGGGCSLPFGTNCRVLKGSLSLHSFLYHVEDEDAERPAANKPQRPAVELRLEGEDPEELVATASAQLKPALEAPLAGRHFVLFGGPRTPILAKQLQAVGASEVRHVRCFDATPIEPTEEDLPWIAEADHLLFSSRNAVQSLARLVASGKVTLRDDATLLAPGQCTIAALRESFPRHERLIGDPPRSLGMGKVAMSRSASCVVGLGAEDGQTEGLVVAQEAGARTRHVPVYRTEGLAGVDAGTITSKDIVLYLAPAAATAVPMRALPKHCAVLAIGPSTARALSRGHVLTATRPDMLGIVGALQQGRQPR